MKRYGTLVMGGTGGTKVMLPTVREPQKFRQVMQQQITALQTNMAA